MPPLCKGRWVSEANPEGLSLNFPLYNPSVSLTLVSSQGGRSQADICTGEPFGFSLYSKTLCPTMGQRVFMHGIPKGQCPFGGVWGKAPAGCRDSVPAQESPERLQRRHFPRSPSSSWEMRVWVWPMALRLNAPWQSLPAVIISSRWRQTSRQARVIWGSWRR